MVLLYQIEVKKQYKVQARYQDTKTIFRQPFFFFFFFLGGGGFLLYEHSCKMSYLLPFPQFCSRNFTKANLAQHVYGNQLTYIIWGL